MAVALLLVTHNRIGDELRLTAQHIMGQLPLPVQSIGVPPTLSIEQLRQQLQHSIQDLDSGDGVLVLSDLFGATPCNAVLSLGLGEQIQVVSGLNLPMLLKVLTYAALPLEALAEKATQGGNRGIQLCHSYANSY